MRIAFRSAVLTSMPTMRDLKAYAAVMDVVDEESTAGSASLSDPTLVMARTDLPDAADGADAADGVPSSPPADPAAEITEPLSLAIVASPAHSESEAPGVSSTQRVRRLSRGIPAPALVLGFGAIAAMLFLVVFFVAGGDGASGSHGSASTTQSEDTHPTGTLVSPAPSFIVITGPDDPNAVTTKPKRPAASAGAAGGRATTKNASTTSASTTSSKANGTSESAATSATNATSAVDPEDVDIYAGTKLNASLGLDAGPAMSAPSPAPTHDAGAKAPVVAPSEPGSGGQTNEEPAPKGGAALGSLPSNEGASGPHWVEQVGRA
jgi:hypothetical protein